jgi:ribose transport system ATP-binding protein
MPYTLYPVFPIEVDMSLAASNPFTAECTRPPLLSVRGLSKTYPGVKALSDVSLDVMPGEVHAVIGENGAGKSTLMMVLAGVLKSDSGAIRIDGRPVRIPDAAAARRLGIGTVFQELSLVPVLSVAENIFATRLPTRWGIVDRRRLAADARMTLGRLSLDIDPARRVGDLAIANRQLVEIARALSQSTRLLILDEPTSSLTTAEADRLVELVRSLRSGPMGTLFISHKMSEVFRVADRITVMREGRIVATRPLNAITPDEAVSLMAGRSVATAVGRSHPAGRVEALRLERVSCRPLVHDVSLSLCYGEIVGLAGLKGAGRSELAQAVFGLTRMDRGTLLLEGRPVRFSCARQAIRAGIGYLPEDRKEEGLFGGLSVWENMVAVGLHRFVRYGVIRRATARREAAGYQERLTLRTPDVDQVVRNLSGGNQQKVLLAKWLICGPRILIVDEPTRGVDVGARADIHNLIRELAERGTALLLISSDMTEILSLADRIQVMADGRIAGELARDEASEQAIMRLATRVRSGVKEQRE